MMRSCVCRSSAAFVIDKPGRVVGMYKSVPSFSVGMNSDPIRKSGHAEMATTATAAATTRTGTFNTPAIMGR